MPGPVEERKQRRDDEPDKGYRPPDPSVILPSTPHDIGPIREPLREFPREGVKLPARPHDR